MKKIYTFLIFTYSLVIFGQTSQLKTADKKYNKYSYIDAAEIYEKVAAKGYKSAELFKKIGNSYYFNGALDKAVKWYDALFALNEEVEAEYYYRYSQCLKATEDYANANKYLALFASKTNDTRGKAYTENENYIAKIQENSNKYVITNTNLNSEFSDFSPAYFNNNLIFTSARKDGAIHSKIHKWTNQNFTDLYIVTKDENGVFSPPTNFSKEINTKYNESSPVFTKDGKTVYFTRNNFNNGKKGKDEKKSTLLKIYRADWIDNKWSKITELPFNNDNYQVAHPALSFDEKTLYFVSDMPGGYGNADIYKVSINTDGTFGKPENLGNVINTEGRESFPFINHENALFFASDGHLGLGGLDIFISKFENGEFQNPENLGKPINSAMDDFSLIIDALQTGYFASNREGGIGYDDIYAFNPCLQKLSGTITDNTTNELHPNSKVTLFDEHLQKIEETTTNQNGVYSFVINCNSKYYVRAAKEEFESNEKTITSTKAPGEIKLDIELSRNIFPFEEGTDLAKIFDISLIYFDLDKWNIRPDAAKDLQKIIEVMQQYPDIHIAIRSHTDSRQTHKYNEMLSERRANATLEFMVKNGIDSSRLTAKGYGETQLINDCSDGVSCSEIEHQKNRRSEFIVIKK